MGLNVSRVWPRDICVCALCPMVRRSLFVVVEFYCCNVRTVLVTVVAGDVISPPVGDVLVTAATY